MFEHVEMGQKWSEVIPIWGLADDGWHIVAHISWTMSDVHRPIWPTRSKFLQACILVQHFCVGTDFSGVRTGTSISWWPLDTLWLSGQSCAQSKWHRHWNTGSTCLQVSSFHQNPLIHLLLVLKKVKASSWEMSMTWGWKKKLEFRLNALKVIDSSMRLLSPKSK